VYSLASTFTLRQRNAFTDARIFVDGVQVFDWSSSLFLDSKSYSSDLALTAGSVVDFAVGYDGQPVTGGNSTQLAATFGPASTVPEHNTGVGLALSLLMVAVVLRRQRGALADRSLA
jgi:hypothetical protein